MFCMTCGTELPASAGACAVCGALSGDAAPQVRQDVMLSHSVAGAPQVRAGRSPFEPSITAGALHQPGLPHDVPGRVVLGAVLVMGADVLLPWFHLAGTSISPASLGAPAFFLVAALVLAVLPVVRVPLARPSLQHVLPVVVGACTGGVGIALWLVVTLVLSQAVVVPLATFSDAPQLTSTLPASLATSGAGIDAGLVIFIAGSVALMWAGWQRYTMVMGRVVTQATRVASSAAEHLTEGRAAMFAHGGAASAQADGDALEFDLPASHSAHVSAHVAPASLSTRDSGLLW